jgi:hypothetical protein
MKATPAQREILKLFDERGVCLTPKERARVLAALGVRTIKPPTWEWCDNCDGCGWVEGGKTLKTTCSKCNGTGRVKRRST